MKAKPIINVFVFFLIFLPFFLWISWVISPKTPLKIMIADKTIGNDNAIEHRSFFWILTHYKFVKPNNTPYLTHKDYFGYFPKEKKGFQINDMKNFNSSQIDSLSTFYDMAYYTDTYGVYNKKVNSETSEDGSLEKNYGGLNQNDFLFLKKMKEKKKLIIAEFNLLAAPTEKSLQLKTQKMLGIIWSGWTSRFFESLDTVKNTELPKWVIQLYKQQHENNWPFKNSGIVFVNEDETIAILENKTNLTHPVPIIYTSTYGQKKFDVPYKVNYPYWTDITYPTNSSHKIVSYYKIGTNKSGDSILAHHGIPHVFPAVIESQDSRFYYFCGDFADNPVNDRFAKFNGIGCFEMFLLNEYDINSRMPFFWRFYVPMVKNILKNYSSSLK